MSDKEQYQLLGKVRITSGSWQQPTTIQVAARLCRALGLEPTTENIAIAAPYLTVGSYSQATQNHMAMHLEEKRGIIVEMQAERDQVKAQAREDRHHAAIYIGAQEIYIHQLEQALQGVRAVLDPLVCADPLNPVCGALQVVLDSVNLVLPQQDGPA